VIGALVPVKQLTASKSRLVPEFDAQRREALSRAMLRDVLAALAAAQRVDSVAVVTPDDAVAAAALEGGARPVIHREPGLNESLRVGAAALGLAPADGLLVVLGDVAGALPADLDALCASLDDAPRPAVALAPAADGGTAALLCSPPDAIAPHFGLDSARRHRQAAEAKDITFLEVVLPSLAIDLDSAEDIEHFLRTQGGGDRTRAALRAAQGSEPA